MSALVSLLCLLSIAIGSLLTLVGLLMIAPQVRVHRIKVYSVGSWLFRAGMILTLLGSVAALSSGDFPTQVIQVAQLMGVAGIIGGIITAGHEWRQARDNNDTAWNWWKSLTLQMVVLGVIVLAMASVSAAR